MNRSARARRFRRNRERYIPWLILGAVVLVAATVAVILGNVLGKRVQELKTPEYTNIQTVSGSVSVPDLRADAFALGYDVSGMKENGTTAVSVILRDDTDTLSYHSGVAVYMNRQTDGTVGVHLADEVSYLHENGIYVSGTFRVLSAERTGADRTAEEYYELSLLSELADSGIDAILLDGLRPDAEQAEVTRSYLGRVRTSSPGTAVGIVLPVAFLSENGAEDRLREWLRVCDWFALDLRDMTDFAAVTELLSGSAYCVHAFPVRLLVHNTDSELIDRLKQSGYTNLQILP